MVGPVQFLVAGFVAQGAWRTPYNWAANQVSDLGAVHCGSTGPDNPPARYVCSPLHEVFNGSAIALGVLFAAGVIALGSAWGRGAVSWASRVLLVLSGMGMVLAGGRPEDVDLNTHVLGAFLIFAMGSAGVLLAGFVPRAGRIGGLRALTLPLGIASMVATWLMFTHHTVGLGPGGMERVALWTLLGWAAATGLRACRWRRASA